MGGVYSVSEKDIGVLNKKYESVKDWVKVACVAMIIIGLIGTLASIVFLFPSTALLGLGCAAGIIASVTVIGFGLYLFNNLSKIEDKDEFMKYNYLRQKEDGSENTLKAALKALPWDVLGCLWAGECKPRLSISGQQTGF